MWEPLTKDADVEKGAASGQPLYPMMLESPELRWAFIRKVYSIIAVQLVLTIAVSAVVVVYHPIALFFTSTIAGVVLYAALCLTSLFVMRPLYLYYQRHPVNYVLLGVFTVSIAFTLGVTCAFTSGKIILEAAILTAVAVLSLAAYTFWAAKRGQDFSFLQPFLLSSLAVLIVFGIILIYFPLGKIATMVYVVLGALLFCAYIVYDTDNLIKRYTYDEYIWAAIALYLDIINLFSFLLDILRSSES